MGMSKLKVLSVGLAVVLLILIIVTFLGMKQSGKTEASATGSGKSAIEIIHKRTSVRDYTERKVTRDQLETLVRAGMAAPTAMNKQPWLFVAIDDKEVLNSLGAVLPYGKMLLKSTAAIVVCGDMNKVLDGHGKEMWIQDCSAASENILLAATDLGLGAVWTGVYPAEDRVSAVKKVLNLPANLIPLNVIPVGYPAGDTTPKDKWKAENLHWNKW